MEVRSPAHAALGLAIKHYRDERGLSQEELAARSGLHRTYVGGIERGERNPSYANLLRIAAALDVTPAALVSYGEGEGQPS